MIMAQNHIKEANLLPKYEGLTFERARVCTVKGNTLIALPIKYNYHTFIEAQNLKNCLHFSGCRYRTWTLFGKS